MSIPRLAIQRPVTMFMIAAVIILLGGISLFRLPVDLLPDVTYPSITVRVGYGGVGPSEIEELIVRRELAFNFARFSPKLDSLESLPDWVQKTLAKHAKDRRDPSYTRAELEQADGLPPIALERARDQLLPRVGGPFAFARHVRRARQ